MRVIVESPFRNAPRDYLLACLRDSINRGESPFASHAIYPLVLDDNNPLERNTGISLGFDWGDVADLIAVYEDLGISEGMQKAIDYYSLIGTTPIVRRKLGSPWS